MITKEYTDIVLGDSGVYNIDQENEMESLINATAGYMKYENMFDCTGVGDDVCYMAEKPKRWIGTYAEYKTYAQTASTGSHRQSSSTSSSTSIY